MDENEMNEQQILDEGIALGEAAKQKVASDPDAVRKIVSNQLANTVEDSVTVYPDKKVNLKFAQFSAEMQQIAGEIPKRLHEESEESYADRTKEFRERLEALESKGEAIRQEVRDSAVTFDFVGIGKRAIKRIRADVRKEFPLPQPGEQDDPSVAEERQDAFEHRVIAAHLVKSGYTHEDIASFHDAWPNKAYADLWATAMKLSIADDYLSGSVNADF